jgi:hypothetical protein
VIRRRGDELETSSEEIVQVPDKLFDGALRHHDFDGFAGDAFPVHHDALLEFDGVELIDEIGDDLRAFFVRRNVVRADLGI